MARANRVPSGARPIALRETPRAAGHAVVATGAPAAHGDGRRHCCFKRVPRASRRRPRGIAGEIALGAFACSYGRPYDRGNREHAGHFHRHGEVSNFLCAKTVSGEVAMPCKHYKDALIEAAASGAEPHAELRAHLAGCVDCRAALEQEQALFASIDAGLHVGANAEAPASLLPRVRARLDEEIAPQRRWIQPLIFAAASVALAFVIFLFARPHQASPDSQAKQTPQLPLSEAPVTDDGHPNSGSGSKIVSFNRN